MKSVFTLVIICFISAVSLATINNITAERRFDNERVKLENAKKNVLTAEIKEKMSEIKEAVEIDDYKFYKVLDNENKQIAVIVEFSGQGFSGDIKLLAAFDNEYKIIGLKPLAHTETPGLGAKMEEISESIGARIKKNNPYVDIKKPWFCEQFKGLTFDKLKLKKEGGEIDAITASTITSRAVTDAVADAAHILKKSNFFND